MKKAFRILGIFVLLVAIGLSMTACSDDTEPRFKIIGSSPYTTATESNVFDSLENQHLKGMQFLQGATSIWDRYRPDIVALLDKEMSNKNPSYGLFVVVKADQYRIICKCYWTNKPNYYIRYWVYE
jgi:hypothetical protein